MIGRRTAPGVSRTCLGLARLLDAEGMLGRQVGELERRSHHGLPRPVEPVSHAPSACPCADSSGPDRLEAQAEGGGSMRAGDNAQVVRYIAITARYSTSDRCFGVAAFVPVSLTPLTFPHPANHPWGICGDNVRSTRFLITTEVFTTLP